jgi:hypothetical protein
MRAHRCSLLVSKLATLFEKRSHLHIHRSLQHWDFSPSAPLPNYTTSAFIVPPLTTSLGGQILWLVFLSLVAHELGLTNADLPPCLLVLVVRLFEPDRNSFKSVP